MLKKLLIGFVALVIVLGVGGYAAFKLSSWPGVLVIRYLFDGEAEKANVALARHVPAGVTEKLNLRYDPNDADALLDVFYPPGHGSGAAVPTVVWIHGGAWVSGSKDLISNYLRVLAGQGFVVVGVDYTIAPSATYPTPVRQANAALGYITREATTLGIDATRLFLAGDSAGSQLSAQLANVIAVPAYAEVVGITPAIERKMLRGVILHCGAYDATTVNFEGGFGGFLKTVLWAYFGSKDFLNDPRLAQFSVINHITADFPPVFISAGNADPLGPQSTAFAAKAESSGIIVDKLFFPADYAPPLGHEYQFTLETDAGKEALARAVAFIQKQGATP
jgi:acetyl esterase